MAEKNENTERNEKEEKFQAKLKELLALAKKKKNVLEYQEISDFFQDMELDAEQFEKILDFLEASNIDVLRITDNDDDTVDDEILLDDEEEVEVEKIDLIRSGRCINRRSGPYVFKRDRKSAASYVRKKKLSWQSAWS